MKYVLFIFIVLTLYLFPSAVFSQDFSSNNHQIYFNSDKDYKYDREEARERFETALELYAPYFRRKFLYFEKIFQEITIFSGEIFLNPIKIKAKDPPVGLTEEDAKKKKKIIREPFLKWKAMLGLRSGCLGFSFNVLGKTKKLYGGPYELIWENQLHKDLESQGRSSLQSIFKIQKKF